MLFALTAIDKAGHLETRLGARPDHLAYWQDNDAAVVLGGPFLDADGKPCGSMLVISAQDMAAAEALVANDPYTLAGLFESVSLRPWTWVLKRPEGE